MSNSDLRDAINNIVQSQYDNKSIIFFCRVTAIDTVNQTFTAQNIKGDSDDMLENCQINVGGNNIVSMPAVGSQVLLIRDNSDNQYYMIKQDEVSSATVSVTGAVKLDSTVSVTVTSPKFDGNVEQFFIYNQPTTGPSQKTEIIFNGGANGGVVRSHYLNSRLLEIEQVLTYWNQIFGAWITLQGDGGAALKLLYTNLVAVNPDAFNPGSTNINDLEDPNFSH